MEHIQLMHSGAHHWLMPFSSNDRVQICDSLFIKNCLKALYKYEVEKIISCHSTSAEVQRWLKLRIHSVSPPPLPLIGVGEGVGILEKS